ncbi:hypothetical protein ACFU1Q_08150 [Brachybacterium paraconglomeratum]
MVDLDFGMLGRMVVERPLEEECNRLLLFGTPALVEPRWLGG